MSEMEISQFELEELIKNLVKKVTSEGTNFDAYAELSSLLNREVTLGDIIYGTGDVIESFIRFWNRKDDLDNIPIEERKPIKIYIDSQGGNLADTLTIVDAISLSKTPVWTINIGCAYSGGFFSFIAGHKRFTYPSATFMFHEGSCGNSGDASKFRNFAAFYDKQLEYLKNITLKYTNITEEEYNKHIKDDWWMFPDEAIKIGVADEIAKEYIN